MEKDLKIGMLLGLFLVIAALVWIATRSDFSLKTRLLRSYNSEVQSESNEPARNNQISQDHTSTETIGPDEPIQQSREGGYKIHTVRSGETLSTISQQYYGTAYEMDKIIKANSIKNPHRLSPGTRLKIPE
jgi:nucleoid-associated protein YgaU